MFFSAGASRPRDDANQHYQYLIRVKGRAERGPFWVPTFAGTSGMWCAATAYEQPVVEPQVSHFMQVPLRTSVKFWHSPQASPS